MPAHRLHGQASLGGGRKERSGEDVHDLPNDAPAGVTWVTELFWKFHASRRTACPIFDSDG
ncbi:hypothetical protein Misp05_00120 [Micromonospora sp. NBRC 107095]|nr:hypothetical protein Misp05_00120 [Micromonospora sp. NBRC 107095]